MQTSEKPFTRADDAPTQNTGWVVGSYVIYMGVQSSNLKEIYSFALSIGQEVVRTLSLHSFGSPHE